MRRNTLPADVVQLHFVGKDNKQTPLRPDQLEETHPSDGTTRTAGQAPPSGYRPIRRLTKEEREASDAKCIAFNQRPRTLAAKEILLRELAAGTMPPDTELCDLDNDVHPLFHRQQWHYVSEELYVRMLPALRWASLMITQPATKFFFARIAHAQTGTDANGNVALFARSKTYTKVGLAWVDEIFSVLPSRTRFSFSEQIDLGRTWNLYLTRRQLASSVNGGAIEWDAKDYLLKHRVQSSCPSDDDGNVVYRMVPNQVISIAESHQRKALTNRCFLISFTTSLLNPFLDSDPQNPSPRRYDNSSPTERLYDLFRFAATLVHEVVHAFGRLVNKAQDEPWYGPKWKFQELGLAWEKWLFEGILWPFQRTAHPTPTSDIRRVVDLDSRTIKANGQLVQNGAEFRLPIHRRVLALGWIHAWFQKATWAELEKQDSVSFMRDEARRLYYCYLDRPGGYYENYPGYKGAAIRLDDQTVGRVFQLSNPNIAMLHMPRVDIWEMTKDPAKRAKDKREKHVRDMITLELHTQQQIQEDEDAEELDLDGHLDIELHVRSESEGVEPRDREVQMEDDDSDTSSSTSGGGRPLPGSRKKRTMNKVHRGRVVKSRSPPRGQAQPVGRLARCWEWIRGLGRVPPELMGGGLAELLPK